MISQATSTKIANVGFLCSLLVVFVHIQIVTGENLSQTGKTFFALVSTGVCKVAVPMFFAISGYLLAHRFSDELWYRKALTKRVRTLCIPLVIWSFLLWLLMDFVDPVAANIFHGYDPFKGMTLSRSEILRILAIDPFSLPFHGNMWYVRSLLILVVISPILKRYCQSGIMIVVLMIIWVMIRGMRDNFSPWIGFSLTQGVLSGTAVLFVVLGINIYKHSLAERCIKTGRVIGCFISVLLVVINAIYQFHPFVQAVVELSMILSIGVSIWNICPSRPFPKWLTAASFPVFVLHVFALRGIGWYCRLHVGSYRYSALDCGLIGCVSIISSICGCLVLKRFCPSFSRVAFGGR